MGIRQFGHTGHVALIVVSIAVCGCATEVRLPQGYLPAGNTHLDIQSSTALAKVPPGQPIAPKSEPSTGQPPAKPPFELPQGLPGAVSPPITPPRFPKDTPQNERVKAVEALYPELKPIPESTLSSVSSKEEPITLEFLQQLAAENNPTLQRTTADVDAAYGQVIQAGLHPNPTFGYQADQVQPSLRIPAGATFSGAGQQGGFVNQLIKTAGKLPLAQKVAGFDYINALVAVRRAQIDVSTAVRTQYFAVLVAQQGVEVNRALADLADDVYRLQLKQVAVGEAAGYEPLQLYAQAEQARNALTQSENSYQAAWKQLTAAIGRPDLPPARLTGKATAPAPVYDMNEIQTRLLDQHTDLLTARNTIAQSQANLTLQRRLRISDVQTNTYQQYDNAAQAYQFGLQIGVQLPISDRNQGNIRSAQANIARSVANLTVVQNDLIGKLAEAFGRYNTNRITAERYRDQIVPNLTKAYRALVRRYQLEPDKVSFNDIVVAQQNLSQSLQAYLAALDAQWRAVVDVASIGQLDELYPEQQK